jgi:hypothetical protein
MGAFKFEVSKNGGPVEADHPECPFANNPDYHPLDYCHRCGFLIHIHEQTQFDISVSCTLGTYKPIKGNA